MSDNCTNLAFPPIYQTKNEKEKINPPNKNNTSNHLGLSHIFLTLPKKHQTEKYFHYFVINAMYSTTIHQIKSR